MRSCTGQGFLSEKRPAIKFSQQPQILAHCFQEFESYPNWADSFACRYHIVVALELENKQKTDQTPTSSISHQLNLNHVCVQEMISLTQAVVFRFNAAKSNKQIISDLTTDCVLCVSVFTPILKELQLRPWAQMRNRWCRKTMPCRLRGLTLKSLNAIQNKTKLKVNKNMVERKWQ